MPDSYDSVFSERFHQIAPKSERYAVEVVDLLLELAKEWHVSDIHLLREPHPEHLRVLMRFDGVLQPIAMISTGGGNVVSRLKVMSNLLTYRNDVPQEGRIRTGEEELEMRVSTFPTVHGEKAVVRMFVGSGKHLHISDLGYSATIEEELRRLLLQRAGLLIVAGPAGSGKTTTAYAALRDIQRLCELKSLCTLEDPVEALLPGVAQSQVKPDSDFNYRRGLASLMRQDPDVILVGEIRDHETARIAFQASLTGHLILSTFHAGNSADAVSRLTDMGIEPYVIRSGLLGLLAQLLMRRRCNCQHGCEACRGTGYHGRLIIAELLKPDLPELGPVILNKQDADTIYRTAQSAGLVPLIDQARAAVSAGTTNAEEFLRQFGILPENA